MKPYDLLDNYVYKGRLCGCPFSISSELAAMGNSMYQFGKDESINKFLSSQCHNYFTLITYFNPRPIVRVWIKSLDCCPKGVRRLTVEEARSLESTILPHIQYDTNLAGGSIRVSGSSKTIQEGMFQTYGSGDDGWGYVLVTEAGINDYEKNLQKQISCLSEIPSQWRRMTAEEARLDSNEKWKQLIGPFEIKQVAGGKVSGSGFKVEEGYFDKEISQVILVTDQLPPS